MTTEQTPPQPPLSGTKAPTEDPTAALAERVERLEAALAEATAMATPLATATVTTPAAVGGNSGYAVYDDTYEKYVGGVHATAKDARAAAKEAGVKKFSIHEV